MSDVIAVLIWWLLLQAMGWAVVPLVFRLLRWLPDRGYSVAKPAGLLLGNYVLWLLGTLGWLRNTPGGSLLAFGLVAVFGVWVYQRWNDGPNLVDWLRAHRSRILAYELVFFTAFAAWAIFRAHNPDLSTTEKPMEFAFMNAIHRSPTLPPPDPWLAGFTISYYYFGYVMMATLMKLSGVSSGVAFSLSNALWFALTAAGAFGIAANLAAASKRAAAKAVIASGLLGALFVPVLSNFEAPLEVAHANAIGSAEFWRWLDIQEINTSPVVRPPGTPAWPPARPGWWWWRASRVVHDYPIDSDRSNPAEYQELIDEFPFFSFLLGDMHPHVLALPYALMSMALAFNLFRMSASAPSAFLRLRSGQALRGSSRDASYSGWRGWFWDAAPIAATYPIFLGALSFLNTWDFPIHVFIVALAWGLGRWIERRPHSAGVSDAADRLDLPSPGRSETFGHNRGARSETGPSMPTIWSDALIALVACGVIGLVVYLPFYIGFRSQAAGIVPNIYNPTRLQQFFVMFGPFLLIGAVFILTLLARAVRQRQVTAARAWIGSLGGGAGIVITAAVLTAAASVVVWALSSTARAEVESLASKVEARGINLSHVIVERLGEFSVPLLLGVSMAAIVWSLGARARAIYDAPDGEGEPAVPFALMLFGSGALLAFAVEYVYLLDQFGTRMNTVFKLYYQAWALWGVASAYAVYYLWRSSERLTSAAGRAAFAGVVAVSVVGGLVYPLLTIQSGTVGRSGTPTLDARAPTMQFAPDEVAAIEWLKHNAVDTSVILEAEGQSYHDGTSRVSGWTGLSSVLGWVGHEGQWRGNYEDILPRQTDIDRIYSVVDPVAALALLRKYGVEYVYVGPNEMAKYPPEGIAKFSRITDMVFQQGSSTIYRLAAAGGSPPAR